MSIYQKIVRRTPIHKGWSIDQKFYVVTEDGQKYLLRISPIDRLERKKREFEQMGQVARLGIPMCLPVEFGICEEGAYSIQSWIEGVDAKDIVMDMDAAEQYRYGWDAGHILARIHTIPAPVDVPAWDTRFNAKIDRYIALYNSCELKYECNDQAFIDYLANNRHLLTGRPQCYQHGDYHIGNMMINKDSLPGGGVEDGEDVLTALQREVHEETGCVCDKIQELGIVSENRASLDYTQINYYFMVTTAHTPGENHLTESELESRTMVKWVTFDELVRLINEQEFDRIQGKYLKARDVAALKEYSKLIME